MATVDWVTTQQVKDALGFSGSARDTAIAAAITAASRALNRRCQHELTPKTASATRTFGVPVLKAETRREGILVDFKPYDLRSATLVRLHPEESSPTTLALNTGYTLLPIGGNRVTGAHQLLAIATDSWTESTYSTRFGQVRLEVTGAWGVWDTADVPEDVKRAAITTVGSWIDKAIEEYGRDFVEDPRAFQPSVFSAYAVPMGALSVLDHAGLVRNLILG